MATGAAQSDARSDYSEFVELAHDLAETAAGVTTSYFRCHPQPALYSCELAGNPEMRILLCIKAQQQPPGLLNISFAALTLLRHEVCRSKLIIDSKADESPVTKADREAEAAMRRLLAERVPDHAIFGAMPHHMLLLLLLSTRCSRAGMPAGRRC